MALMRLVLSDYSRQSLSVLKTNMQGAYIFSGPESIGKYSAAKHLAIEHSKRPENIIEVVANTDSIGIEEMHALRHELQLKTHGNQHRSVLIDNAHKLTIEAQNALLKTLEEPPIGTSIILVTNNLDGLALTIRSRCKLVRFSNPPSTLCTDYLMKQYDLTRNRANQIMLLSNQKIGLAIKILQDSDKFEKLKTEYAKIKHFATSNLFYRMVDAQELTDNSEQVLYTIIQNMRQAIIKAIESSDYAKVSLLNLRISRLISLLEYLDANGNKKIAIDLAALQLESA